MTKSSFRSTHHHSSRLRRARAASSAAQPVPSKSAKGDSGMNKITFDVDSSTFKPDEYIVTEDAVIQEATGTALFNVLEGAAPTAVPTTVVTTAAPTAGNNCSDHSPDPDPDPNQIARVRCIDCFDRSRCSSIHRRAQALN